MNAPHYDRPPISHIADGLGPDKVRLFIGGADAARDIDLLRQHDITTVINCAVNLDINYVDNPNLPAEGSRRAAGSAPVRTYKVGLVDGDGNPEHLLLGGYFLLDSALRQTWPEKSSYPMRKRGNVLVHCRGGRSRSVVLAALYLHRVQADIYPTLYDALRYIRKKRQLHPDEWFETPKPVLTLAALRAAEALDILAESQSRMDAVSYDADQDC